jgi:hypothetical protein
MTDKTDETPREKAQRIKRITSILTGEDHPLIHYDLRIQEKGTELEKKKYDNATVEAKMEMKRALSDVGVSNTCTSCSASEELAFFPIPFLGVTSLSDVGGEFAGMFAGMFGGGGHGAPMLARGCNLCWSVYFTMIASEPNDDTVGGVLAREFGRVRQVAAEIEDEIRTREIMERQEKGK